MITILTNSARSRATFQLLVAPVFLLMPLLFVMGHFTNRQALGVNTPLSVKRYYVDNRRGSDSNSGLTTDKPWKTLDRVNRENFSPGSEILFRAGGVWTGQLAPHGSGTAGSPVVVRMYGKGKRPLLSGNGLTGQGVVYLSNQSYWEINDLEITNDAAEEGDRRGVEITAANKGVIRHIWLQNLEIHQIKGRVGHDAPQKRTAGIYLTVTADDTATRYDDVLIANCKIHDVQNEGIVINNEVSGSDYPGTPDWEKRRITNLIIRGNVIHHISKNAMIIRLADQGLVEHNVCYETALGITGNTIFSRSCRGTIFQYNEGYLNRSPDFDGSMYDADLSSPGTIWQYSYSHDNAHGLMWFCTTKPDTGIIVRYNISQNDKGNLVYFNYAFTSAKVYNNVFYIGKDVHPTIIAENLKNPHHYQFYNNIIYNQSSGATYKFARATDKTTQERDMAHNLFYGFHPTDEPADPFNITGDPLFVNAGAGATGLGSLAGYQLKVNSPAIRAGKLVPDNGGKDFFGNPVSPSFTPHIGIYDGPGVK